MDKLFAKFANATAKATGSPVAFLLCVAAVLIWALSGPIFKFSETWQLVINTGTTIVTFLMVFLIQNTQNRDGLALQTKLDELIRSSAAENAFMGIETLTDKELAALHSRCQAEAERSAKIAARAKAEQSARGREKSRADEARTVASKGGPAKITKAKSVRSPRARKASSRKAEAGRADR